MGGGLVCGGHRLLRACWPPQAHPVAGGGVCHGAWRSGVQDSVNARKITDRAGRRATRRTLADGYLETKSLQVVAATGARSARLVENNNEASSAFRCRRGSYGYCRRDQHSRLSLQEGRLPRVQDRRGGGGRRLEAPQALEASQAVEGRLTPIGGGCSPLLHAPARSAAAVRASPSTPSTR